jgi:hypothetical protein
VKKENWRTRIFILFPEMLRIMREALPKDLKKGKYTATAVINYGNKDELKVVELEFAR